MRSRIATASPTACQPGSSHETHVADREDLARADVILIHRLLENSISDDDGPHAYAFFTDACLSRVSSTITLPAHSETCESFGEARGGVHDLGPVLEAMRAARREFITSEDADFESSVELPVPPAAAWQYVVDPVERQRWAWMTFSKDPDEVTPNTQGRVGPGATTHCNHGPGIWLREYLDWRPFAYFTCRNTLPPRFARIVGIQHQIEAFEFLPIGEHSTRIVMRVRVLDPRRRTPLRLGAFRRLSAPSFRSRNAALLSIAEDDLARTPA